MELVLLSSSMGLVVPYMMTRMIKLVLAGETQSNSSKRASKRNGSNAFWVSNRTHPHDKWRDHRRDGGDTGNETVARRRRDRLRDGGDTGGETAATLAARTRFDGVLKLRISSRRAGFSLRISLRRAGFSSRISSRRVGFSLRVSSRRVGFSLRVSSRRAGVLKAF